MSHIVISLKAECEDCSALARSSVEQMLDVMREAIVRGCEQAVAQEGAALRIEKVIADNGEPRTVLSQPYLGCEDFDFLEAQYTRLDEHLTAGRQMEAALAMFELRQWLDSKRPQAHEEQG